MSSKDKMFATVREYEQSGLSVSAFCKKNKLALSTFRYWIELYNDSEKLATTSSFISVETSPAVSASVEILYPNQVSIRVSTQDLSFIKELINLY